MTLSLYRKPNQPPVTERVLVVGLGARPFNCNGRMTELTAQDGPVMTTHLRVLDQGVLGLSDPHLVVCALFAPMFDDSGEDAVALIERLQTLGYGGRIAVLGPDLPRPDLVEAELRALGPGARLTLIAVAA